MKLLASTFSRIALFVLVLLGSFSACKKPMHVLVFFETKGYYHTSIPTGVAAIQQWGQAQKVGIDTTSNSELFTKQDLTKYSAIIFLNTTGDVFNEAEQIAFQKYIEQGGGFVGIHAATDTEYDWPWYNHLVGAYFKSHPKQQDAVVQVANADHPATKKLPTTWKRWDEWYNFKSIQSDLKVLLTVDESSYQGGENGASHPISWYHKVGKGRAFYTALGHTNESYTDPNFMEHLKGGIAYAAGWSSKD